MGRLGLNILNLLHGSSRLDNRLTVKTGCWAPNFKLAFSLSGLFQPRSGERIQPTAQAVGQLRKPKKPQRGERN
jgi:hypothetical protein